MEIIDMGNFRAESFKLKRGKGMEIACLMRDILKALNDFERDFERTHGVCLNEAAVLCSLKSGRLSASDIAAKVGLTPSHASKVILQHRAQGTRRARAGPAGPPADVFRPDALRTRASGRNALRQRGGSAVAQARVREALRRVGKMRKR